MPKFNKRMKNISKNINFAINYKIEDALVILKKISIVNFIESLDVSIKLGIKYNNIDQNVSGNTILPYGTGRKIIIAVFAEGKDADNAKLHGADIVGMKSLYKKIKNGYKKIDVIIASKNSMNIVNKLINILGPRGLTPNDKFGTITNDIIKSIKNFRKGQINYKSDKYGIINTTIGKLNFDNIKLIGNLENLILSIKKNKPVTSKGTYIKKIKISTTMGVGLSIDKNSLFDKKKIII
ncbi:MAG: 50S ribosomal protein L1 [Candidatus Makana argininalis]